MKYILSITIGLLLHFSGFAQANVDCKIEFESSFSQQISGGLYQIDLELKEGNGKFEISLFDMVDNKLVTTGTFESEKGHLQTVFNNLEKGNYLIGINQGDCRQTIGGIRGIKIE
jgi:hypothetical protein